MSSTKFANCVPAGSRNIDGPGDKHYAYPVNQRAYDATGGKGSDAQPFTVVSKDNAEMAVPVTLTLTLKSDCETVRAFHERIGNRYAAYFNGDTASSGWLDMLNFAVGKPLDTVLDRTAQNHTWRKLWNDPATKAAMEQQVERDLPAFIKQQTGGDYFTVGQVTILKPTPTDSNLVKRIQDEQSSVAAAGAAEAEAKARKISAEAQIAVEKAEAAKIKERTKVIGIDGWLKEQAIEKGLNPWQPVIVPGMPDGAK
jgi:hypothetical protein